MYALKIELKTQPSQWQIPNAAAIAWEHMDNKWKQTRATCDGVCSAHHTSAQHQKSTISTILSSLMHLTLVHVLNPCDEQEYSLNLLSRRGETAGFWCASSQHLRTFNALGLISGKRGNLDSLFPGDSTGALFQGVSAVASHPVLDFGVQFPTGRSLPDPRDPAQPWDLFAGSNTDAVKVC